MKIKYATIFIFLICLCLTCHSLQGLVPVVDTEDCDGYVESRTSGETNSRDFGEQAQRDSGEVKREIIYYWLNQ